MDSIRPPAFCTLSAVRAALFPALLLLLCLAVPGVAADWRHFRGPDHDGSAAAEWPDQATLEVAWRAPIGHGYSGVVAAGDQVYTCFGAEGSDWLGAFDADTGEELWRIRLGEEFAAFAGGHGGPSATPAFGDGLVFAVGGHGSLVAARPDGAEVWRRDLAEFAEKPNWGFASSPTVVTADGGSILLVQAPGRDGQILFGLDPATGKQLWSTPGEPVQYQSPVVASLVGREQVVVSSVSALHGVSLDGELLWTFPYDTDVPSSVKDREINVPLKIGSSRMLVKITAEEAIAVEVGRAEGCTAADCKWRAHLAWTSGGIGRSYVPSIHHDGLVYGYQGTILTSLDAEDGERVWRSRPPGDGFLGFADGRLVVMTKKGSLHLGSAGRDGWTEEASLEVFDDSSWTEPTISGDAIFVRSMEELARLDVVSADKNADADDEWIDFTRPGSALPDTHFGRFIRSLEETGDRSAAIDEFLSAVESFPVVEDTWVHFVYRGPQEGVGVSGDMVGERTQSEMVNVPGTDLFYFSQELPRDAKVSYIFHTASTESGILDPLNPRRTVWPREGSEFDLETQFYSRFHMPDGGLPTYLTGEPKREGRIETHVFDISGIDAPVNPPPVFTNFIKDGPPDRRRIRVYVPAGHDPDRPEPYPVVFVYAGEKVLEGLDAKRTLDHLVGDELPDAVVVFVDRLIEFLAADSSWSFELHRRSLYDLVLPFLRTTYGVGEEYHLSFGFGGPIVLRTSLAEQSTASRIAMVQPWMLDVVVPVLLVGVDQVPPERRPAVYLETSRIDLRAVHETWNISTEHRKVAGRLSNLGWDVTLETNSCGFFWSAWRDRLGPALAFVLTGEAEIPSDG